MHGFKVKRLWAAESGSTAVMFAVSFLPILSAIGLSVDGGRAFMVHSQLVAAVDVAALSAARNFNNYNNDQRVEVSREFFNANFSADTSGTRISSYVLTPVDQGTVKQVTVDATAVLPTVFMRVFGINTVTLSATAVAQRNYNLQDVVLALDNTGSMALASSPGSGVSRIDALKSATGTLVEALYQGNENASNLNIGIIPYTAYVNVGKLLEPGYVIPIPGFTDLSSGDPLAWKGCVDADQTNTNAPDDINNPAWNTAYDTQEMRSPAAGGAVRASLFPYLNLYWDYTVTSPITIPAETCPGATERICVEGDPTNCYDRPVSCTPQGPRTVDPGTHTNFYAVNIYNVIGKESTFVRTGAPPAGQPDLLPLDPPGSHNYGYNSTGPSGLPNPPSTPPVAQNRLPWSGAAPAMRPYPSYDVRLPNPVLIGTVSSNFQAQQRNPGTGNPEPVDTRSASGVNIDGNAQGSPNLYCPEEAFRLANHRKSAVINYANTNLKAFFPDWGTFSNLGLLWAWRMLSPELPLAGRPNSTGVVRSIILMTDGEIYHPGGITPLTANPADRYTRGNLYDGFYQDGIRTPYGFASEAKLTPNYNSTNAQLTQALRNRLRKTCQNAKNAGITIYTVTFTPSLAASEKDVYRECASQASYYFDAPDATALTEAFARIADNLSQVRLVE